MTHCQIARISAAALVLLLGACDAGSGSASEASDRSAAEAASSAPLRWRGRLLSAALDRPSFTLRDTDGEPYRFGDRTGGRLTLLFFGYTHCPDVCPAHLGQIAAAVSELDAAHPGVREQLDMVFVGVDAERDTGPRVREWLDHFDDSFVGLVGTADELAAAQKAALIPPASRDPGGTDASYTVSHASYILLYTPDDKAHLRYAFDTRQADWVHDLGQLLTEGFRS